jgi:hypothetical protein
VAPPLLSWVVRILNTKGAAMLIEDKFKKFNLTDEMTEHLRFLAALTKKSDEQAHSYAIKTIVLGIDKADSTEQGAGNAELG